MPVYDTLRRRRRFSSRIAWPGPRGHVFSGRFNEEKIGRSELGFVLSFFPLRVSRSPTSYRESRYRFRISAGAGERGKIRLRENALFSPFSVERNVDVAVDRESPSRFTKLYLRASRALFHPLSRVSRGENISTRGENIVRSDFPLVRILYRMDIARIQEDRSIQFDTYICIFGNLTPSIHSLIHRYTLYDYRRITELSWIYRGQSVKQSWPSCCTPTRSRIRKIESDIGSSIIESEFWRNSNLRYF